jgi:prephenate dehydrogenase
MWNKIAIVGVGLIGGSLAAALKANALCPHIVGIGRQQSTLDEALALGLVDSVSLDMAAVAGCDLVVLCAPVAQTAKLLTAMRPYLSAHTLITDAGSTKQDVVQAAKIVLGSGESPQDLIANFIPAHPIAGKAQHGPSAADALLYHGKRVVMTPLAENKPAAIMRVAQLWESVGAQVTQMSPLRHDTVFSSVSHLPHLLAYALVAQIVQDEDSAIKFGYAGAGFRDFTRIAASSPEMWRDIFTANKEALLKDLRTYQAMLGHMEMLLVTNHVQGLEKLISKAAQARQAWDKPEAET